MAASEYSPILCRASLDVTFHLAVWKSAGGKWNVNFFPPAVKEFRIDLDQEKFECC